MKDIVEAERLALSLVVKLSAYKTELQSKFKLSQSENRDFARLKEVEAVLKMKGDKVMRQQNGYGEWICIVMTAILSYGLAASAVLLMTGCGAGYEIGARAGIYRVDERNDASRTYASPTPLKCFFVNCGTVTATPQGGSNQ